MLFVSMLIIDIFLMGTFFGIDELQERLVQSTTKEQRFTAAELTFAMFKDHLWTGVGFGAFFAAFPMYRTADISLYYDHAHNDFAEFAAELGLLGLWPLATIWIMSFYWAIRVQIERQSPLMKAMGFSATMAMIAIAIHSTTDFNLQISSNAATFMVILALPYVAYCVDRGGRKSAGRRSSAKAGLPETET
jgi:O-antigen ligase